MHHNGVFQFGIIYMPAVSYHINLCSTISNFTTNLSHKWCIQFNDKSCLNQGEIIQVTRILFYHILGRINSLIWYRFEVVKWNINFLKFYTCSLWNVEIMSKIGMSKRVSLIQSLETKLHKLLSGKKLKTCSLVGYNF